MQLHMFWALYIHAADAQDVTGDWEKQQEVWDDLRNLRAALLGVPDAEGHARPPPRAGARPDARGLHDARRLRRVVGEEGERLHALLGRARRHPGHDVDRLVRRLPPRRHRVLRRDGAEELVAAAAARRALEPRRHARRRHLYARRRLRARLALGRAALLRGAARVLRALAEGRRRRGAGWARRQAGADLRHGRRQRAQDRRSASSTTAAAGATRTSGRSHARGRPPCTSTATGRCAEAPPGGREPRRFTYDPEDPVPTIGGLYCAVGEFPPEGDEHRADVGRDCSTRRSGCGTS